MRSKTPAEKVRAYRIRVQGCGIAAGALVILGITAKLFAYGLPARMLFIMAAISLTTAFASSRSQLAKEVDIILAYCRERECGYGDYPTTLSQCDELREDEGVFQELIRLATTVIRAEEKVRQLRTENDPLGHHRAIIEKSHARKVFLIRWRFYQQVGPGGILPFKDKSQGRVWHNEEEFLKSVLLGMITSLRSKQYA
jgi:hypothetical protein